MALVKSLPPKAVADFKKEIAINTTYDLCQAKKALYSI